MGLESGTYINSLNPLNPVGAVDPKAQGDDHLRLIKATLQASFPNISGAMTVTHTALNALAAIGFTGFAAPSVSVKAGSPAAGAATTVLRSDARLVIDLTDSYAWAGTHSFAVATTSTGNGTGTSSAFNVNGAGNAAYSWRNSSAAADAKLWDARANGNNWILRTLNDAQSLGKEVINATRAANVVSDLSFGNSSDNPTYGFLGTGALSVSGALNVAGQARLTTATAEMARLHNSSGYIAFYNTAGSSRTGYVQGSNGSAFSIVAEQNIPMILYTNNIDRLYIAGDGGIYTTNAVGTTKGIDTINAKAIYTDGANVRSIPRSTTATTVAIGDLGKCIAATANIAIPVSVFSAGDCFTIYNDSAAAINITQSAGNIRLAGTTTAASPRILAPRGLATCWFNTGGATPDVVVSGPGVS